MKAIYTESARQELGAFQDRQKAMLEELVAERKSVLGDDVLEITASDIKEASQRIRAYRPTIRRLQSTELVTRAYIVIGIAMMVGSFFYREIQTVLVENQTQALIFIMGASMAAAGWLFKYWLVARRRRLLEEADKYLAAIEQRQRSSDDIPRKPRI